MEEQEKKMDPLALSSFICSIIGLFVFGLPLGIVAIILGITSVVKGKEKQNKGQGLGIAGICIGAIDAVYVIMAVILAAM